MSMENTLTALFSIIILDLVLAGDNALVIGLAASRLPAQQQKKAIIWGALVAMVIRTLATFAVVWLLKIPGLLCIGGLILLYIAYHLINHSKKQHTQIHTSTNLLSALQTIVIADVMMGLDNVLAMAGASQGNFILIIIGLLITVPIIMGGSTLCAKLISHFPALIYLGAGVLAYTAATMITSEPYLSRLLASQPMIKYGIILFFMISVFSTKIFSHKSC